MEGDGRMVEELRSNCSPLVKHMRNSMNCEQRSRWEWKSGTRSSCPFVRLGEQRGTSSRIENREGANARLEGGAADEMLDDIEFVSDQVVFQ